MFRSILVISLLVVIFGVKLAVALNSWQVYRNLSVMDDSKKVQLELTAENVVKGWLTEARPTLLIRCQENKTEIFIRTEMSSSVEYGLYQRHTVRIRLDDGNAFKQRWSDSTDNKALFASSPISLARKIAKAETMLFEFTPFNANPALVEFNVEGLNEHLEELADTCHWKINPPKKVVKKVVKKSVNKPSLQEKEQFTDYKNSDRKKCARIYVNIEDGKGATESEIEWYVNHCL